MQCITRWVDTGFVIQPQQHLLMTYWIRASCNFDKYLMEIDPVVKFKGFSFCTGECDKLHKKSTICAVFWFLPALCMVLCFYGCLHWLSLNVYQGLCVLGLFCQAVYVALQSVHFHAPSCSPTPIFSQNKPLQSRHLKRCFVVVQFMMELAYWEFNALKVKGGLW